MSNQIKESIRTLLTGIVDYAGLLGKEMFLDSFELKDADLYFRLDPENPRGERLQIRNFSARVYLTGDRIQIRRSEGIVNGIEVSLRGLFFNADSGTEGDGIDTKGESGGGPGTTGDEPAKACSRSRK